VDRKIDALWRVTDKVTVDTPSGPLTVYMRTVGDTQNDDRVKEALSSARLMNTRLANRDTDEFRWHLAHVADMPREVLVEAACQLTRAHLVRESFTEIYASSWPVPGKKDGVIETIAVEDQRDEIEKEVEQARVKWIDDRYDAYKADVETISEEQLRSFVTEDQTTAVVNAEFSKALQRATLYFACYKDKRFKQKLFGSIGEAGEANHNVVSRLMNAYNMLDRWTQSSEELKKLPPAAE